MLYAVFALFVLLLYQKGMHLEYVGFLERQRFDRLVGPVQDDVAWDDRMDAFHRAHPGVRQRISARMR